MIKLRFTIIGLLVAVGLSMSPPADAAKICSNDYYGFIRKARSENLRHEYFQDFFGSYCQLADILVLEEQLNDVRDNFREDAYFCKDTSKYKTKYHAILMEIYFIRHVQEISSDVLEPFESEEAAVKKEITLEKLKKDMIKIFVTEERRVTETELNDYFDSWADKYDDKIIDYAACEEGPWAEVNEVWLDFKETWDALDVSVEKKKRDGKFFQFSETEKDDTSGWSKVKSTFKSFGDKFKKQKLEKVEDPIDIDAAAKQTGSIAATFKALEESEQRYDSEYNSALRMARYQLLYGEGGARPASDLQAQLQGINEALEDTNITDFPNIITNVKKISDKQCK